MRMIMLVAMTVLVSATQPLVDIAKFPMDILNTTILKWIICSVCSRGNPRKKGRQ
jgi:hypothetical protein